MSGASGLRKHGHTSAGDGGTISLPSDAVDVTYDNSGSGLAATDVQGAVDELDTTLDTFGSPVDIADDAANITGVNFADQGSNPTTPATTHTIVFTKSDGLYVKDDGGTVTGPLVDAVGAGVVGSDTIWDAAGDLAVGTGADTAAKLTKGSAGGALSIINAAVAWNSGTSNPGSAVTGDRYWRTDLGLEVYYDGTRWVTTQLFNQEIVMQTAVVPLSASNSFYSSLPNASGNLWMVEIQVGTQVQATNDATHYWDVSFLRFPSGSAIGSAFDTKLDTAATATGHTVTVGALSGTTDRGWQISMVKNSTAGDFYLFGATMFYRRVVI